MARNNDILNYLATPAEFATPQQLEDAQSYSQAMMPKESPQIHHLAQGGDYVLRALLGNITNQARYKQHHKSNDLLIDNITGRTPPPPMSTGVPQQASAPAAAPGMLNAPAVPATRRAGEPKGGYATIRNNNPGGQWPGPSATKFGATGHQNLADGNKIATFSTPEAGAAATFDLLDTRYTGKPVVQALARWKGGNTRDAAAVAHKLGLNPNEPITQQMLRSPAGIQLVKEIANSEAPVPFPLDDAGWAKAQQMAFGGDTGQIPVADATIPALKAPIQVASADNSIPESALPPELMGLGSPPSQVPALNTETAAIPPAGGPAPDALGNAPAPPIMPDNATGSIPSENNSQVAQNYTPNESFPASGLPQRLPPPPPSGLGLTPEMWKAGLQNPELFGSLVSKLQAAHTPIYTDVEGGKAWVIPATGERGLIPGYKLDSMEAGGTKIPMQFRPDTSGKMQPSAAIPNFGGSNNGGGGPASSGGMGIDNGVPGQQGAIGDNPTSPNIYTPPSLTNIKSADDLVKYDQRAQAAKAAVASAYGDANKALVEPIDTAIDAGSAASKTIEIMKALEGMETLDATQNMHTGPWAEKFIKIDQTIQDLFGITIFNPSESLTAAQALSKIGVFLTTASTKELTSRPAVAEFLKYLETNPSVLVTPEARRTLVSYIHQSSKQTKAVGDAAMRALQQGPDGIISWPQMKAKALADNPITIELKVPKTNPAATGGPRKYTPGKGWGN